MFRATYKILLTSHSQLTSPAPVHIRCKCHYHIANNPSSASPKLSSAIYTFKSWKIHFVTYLNQCALIVCRASDPAWYLTRPRILIIPCVCVLMTFTFWTLTPFLVFFTEEFIWKRGEKGGRVDWCAELKTFHYILGCQLCFYFKKKIFFHFKLHLMKMAGKLFIHAVFKIGSCCLADQLTWHVQLLTA